MLLSEDTVIHTLSGDKTVASLYGRIGPSFGYCWDGERITINRFKVGEIELLPTIEIELDDNTKIYCDTETRILKLIKIPAYPLSLNSGSSLLPLYFKRSNGYLRYREPGSWFKNATAKADCHRWRNVSRMVAEYNLGRRLEQGERVYYVNGDKNNNRPSNIEVRLQPEKKIRKVKNFAEPLIQAWELLNEVENDPLLRIKLPKRKRNHKIIRASLTISRDLFSIKVFDSVNLAVSGIFISE